MSTAFEVFPGKDSIPTVTEVLELSTQYLHEYLTSVGIQINPTVKLEIRNDNELISVPTPEQPLKWNEDDYGWFTISPVPGGCDAYFQYVDDIRREAWEDEMLASSARCADFADAIRTSIGLGYYWCFRRSVGQSGIVSLYYGLLAAAVAEITNGFVYSDDGAWDFQYFPIRAEEFRKIYFRPDKTVDKAEWVQWCISAIPDELKMGRQ